MTDNDYDLECVSKALQVREQSRFIDAYAPLSPAAVSAGDAVLKSVTYDGKPILQ